jgi:hypothetical protein
MSGDEENDGENRNWNHRVIQHVRPSQQIILGGNIQRSWEECALQLDQLPPKMQSDSLMAILGPEVIQTFQCFKQIIGEQADPAVIRQKYESHFIPAINRTFERYTFNQTFMNLHFDRGCFFQLL